MARTKISVQNSATNVQSPTNNSEEAEGNNQSKGITFLLCMSVFGAICGTNLTLGYNLSVINNPSSIIKTFFSEIQYNRTGTPFTPAELNWYWSSCVAALPILAPLGCFIGSKSAKKFGRKYTLLANNILLIIGGLMQAVTKPANSYELFFLGRLVLGLQTGIGSTVGPMYVSEVSPIRYRGAFGALNSWIATFGLLLSSILGFEEILGNEEYWPHLFTILLGFAGVQILVLSCCPESPHFLLIDKKDGEKSIEALKRLRGKNYYIERDLRHMVHEESKIKEMPEVLYSDFLRKRELRQPIILAFAAVCCLQFSGVVAIIMYSEPIFATVLSLSGHPNSHMATRLPAIETLTRLIVTAVSLPFLDKFGRRKFELISISGLIICNTVLAFLLSNVATDDQTCYGFPVGKRGNHAALATIFIQSICVSPGVNAIAWIITPELFRTNARPKAAFLVSTIYWAANFLVSLSFDLIQNAICGWVFLIFAAFQVSFFVYFWFKFPILDGKTVDEIASMFESYPCNGLLSGDTMKSEEQSCDERTRLLR